MTDNKQVLPDKPTEAFNVGIQAASDLVKNTYSTSVNFHIRNVAVSIEKSILMLKVPS